MSVQNEMSLLLWNEGSTFLFLPTIAYFKVLVIILIDNDFDVQLSPVLN